ncbi:MAG: DUF177 domain-containing protein [Ruminococcus sp.]|nr:DUF177 domain-containing protein [Ruminococcus sp.]MCR5142173.1 DUF177 domain-containing protein [Ruminococcus sp.]
MILQLRQIFELSGQSVDIDVSLPAEQLNESEPFLEFSAPLEIRGAVKSRSGVVTLDYAVKTTLSQQCDRCLKAFDREYGYEFSHTLVRELANDSDEDEYEDYIVCPDNTLDIAELALSELKLSLPSKILCNEDCLGLCPVCGQDLNEGDCECEEI